MFLLVACLIAITSPTSPNLTGLAGNCNLTSAEEVVRLRDSDFAQKFSFDLTGIVVQKSMLGHIIESPTGIILSPVRRVNASTGEVVRIRGYTNIDNFAQDHNLIATNTETLGIGTLPAPALITIREINDESVLHRRVKVRGFVMDVLPDEIDNDWHFLILNMDGQLILVATPNVVFSRLNLARSIDAEVELIVIVTPKSGGKRKHLGMYLTLIDCPDCIRYLTVPDPDPFAVPLLENVERMSPARIRNLHRRKTIGTVLGHWDNDKILIDDANGMLVQATLSKCDSLPQAGELVEAVGFPESGIYHINLTQALIRPHASAKPTIHPDRQNSPKSYLELSRKGLGRYNPDLHGKLVRLQGVVRTTPRAGSRSSRIRLQCEDDLVSVDLDSCPRFADALSIGCLVDVTGVCILEMDSWTDNNLLPAIRDVLVVPRTESDLKILDRPSWWTPEKLGVVIGILFLSLIAIAVWNALLQKLVERRSRELVRSQAEKLASDLRIDERTRIATELHDYLAQNLAATSYQLTAAKFAKDQDPKASEHHLETACTMLNSSRTELRRCLWDLRSDALEEPTFEKAIRRTLQQILNEDTILSLDLNLSRSAVSDTTAHTILSIIREFVANAILHGRAKSVWISGEIRNGTLCIRVRDDGCGFDTTTRKDSEAGHFGLDGVRNRIERSGGRFDIRSTPGRGTEATIELPTSKQTGP